MRTTPTRATQGYMAMGLPGVAAGLAKAGAGVPLRPALGFFEGMAKGSYGSALVFLGKEGIAGSYRRRVRAPSASPDDVGGGRGRGGRSDAAGAAGAQLMPADTAASARARAAALAAWQQGLDGGVFPRLQGDSIVDVVDARDSRCVLVTNRHVAWLTARGRRLAGAGAGGGAQSHVFRVRWIAAAARVQAVNSDPERLRISLSVITKRSLGPFGDISVPRQRGMRCATRGAFEQVLRQVSFVLQRDAPEAAEARAARQRAEAAATPLRDRDLSIVDAPYDPPSA